MNEFLDGRLFITSQKSNKFDWIKSKLNDIVDLFLIINQF